MEVKQIKAAYFVRFSPKKGYRAAVAIGIPCDQGTDRVSLRHLAEIAICGETLSRDWGYTYAEKQWIREEFQLGDDWENHRIQQEEIGTFSDPELARCIAAETANYYRRILRSISEFYDRAILHDSVVHLS